MSHHDVPQKVSQAVERVTKKHGGTVTGMLGVAFRDLRTQEEFYLNGDTAFPAASVFKIFLLAELFRQAEAGKFSLSDRIPLEDSEKSPGSGVLKELGEGLNPTIRDCATLMMILSDNTATDKLFNLVGRENIKKNVLDALGLTRTRVDWGCRRLIARYCDQPETADADADSESERSFRDNDLYLCRTDENDQTSPADTARFLALLAENRLVSERASRDMLHIMSRCQTNSRIPRHLPRGLRIAHKTGTLDRVANDVGIVYTERGSYVLALFYNGNAADEEEYARNEKGRIGDDLLAELSRDIYLCAVGGGGGRP